MNTVDVMLCSSLWIIFGKLCSMPATGVVSKPSRHLVIFCTLSAKPHGRGASASYAHVIHKAFPTDWGQVDHQAEPFQPATVITSRCGNGATLSNMPLAAVCPRVSHRVIHRGRHVAGRLTSPVKTRAEPSVTATDQNMSRTVQALISMVCS
ncbi:hypothetical protein D3C81_1851400 [compost metagenome]